MVQFVAVPFALICKTDPQSSDHPGPHVKHRAKMTPMLDPLPLENRRREPDSTPRARLKLTLVSLVAHAGLCIAGLSFWIFAALFLRPPLDRMVAYQKLSAGFGAVAMVLLAIFCIATMMRFTWARAAMTAWAVLVLAWRVIVLLVDVFVWSQVYRARAGELIAEAATAATNPATQPSQFGPFITYGLYMIPLLTFLLFGGYAYAVWRAMRSPHASLSFGR